MVFDKELLLELGPFFKVLAMVERILSNLVSIKPWFCLRSRADYCHGGVGLSYKLLGSYAHKLSGVISEAARLFLL